MAVLGEWLCLRKELQAIPIVSGVGGSSSRQLAGAATRAAGTVGVALSNLSGRVGVGSSRDRDKDGQPVP